MPMCPYCAQTSTHKDEHGFCKRYNCAERAGFTTEKKYITQTNKNKKSIYELIDDLNNGWFDYVKRI